MAIDDRTLLESASPVWIVDEAQRITHMNAAARELFQIPPDASIAGRACYAVVRGRHLDGAQLCQANCEVVRTARSGEPAPGTKLLLPQIDGRNGDGHANGGSESDGYQAVTEIEVETPRRWLPCEVQHLVIRLQDQPNALRMVHMARDLQRMEAVLQFSEQVLAAAQRFIIENSGENPMRKLTPQERRVLAALAEGHDTPRVAEMLGVSKSTVRNHTQHILKKLDCHSRLEAVALVQPYLAAESIRTSERALDLLDI